MATMIPFKVMGLAIASLCLVTFIGCVHGVVVDSNNYPIKYIEVQLTNLESGETLTEWTDDEGRFAFFPIVDGRFEINASRYGYNDLTRAFVKDEGLFSLGETVMDNCSTVMVHEFDPPSLEAMRELEPAIATRQFTVYLPPSYAAEPERQYPAVYLLHGNEQNHLSYFHPYSYNGLLGFHLQSVIDELVGYGVSREFILVVPNGTMPEGWLPYAKSGSFFVNSAYNGNFETYVVDDLVDCVENNTNGCLWEEGRGGYRVIPKGASRGVQGASMGVIGALNMALRYPGRFAAVAVNYGPVSFNELIFPFTPGIEPFAVKILKNRALLNVAESLWGALFAAVDGEHYPDNDYPIEIHDDGEMTMTMVEDPDDPEAEVELWSNYYLRHDPYTYLAENPEAAEGLSFYLDCGDHDEIQLYENNRAFSALLEELGLEPSGSMATWNRHFFEIYPNVSHVDLITRDRIRKGLIFLANHLAGEDAISPASFEEIAEIRGQRQEEQRVR
ncbi:alpha/beta hydrolase-fold protein [Thermodesulfobacteriota bacterium]